MCVTQKYVRAQILTSYDHSTVFSFQSTVAVFFELFFFLTEFIVAFSFSIFTLYRICGVAQQQGNMLATSFDMNGADGSCPLFRRLKLQVEEDGRVCTKERSREGVYVGKYMVTVAIFRIFNEHMFIAQYKLARHHPSIQDHPAPLHTRLTLRIAFLSRALFESMPIATERPEGQGSVVSPTCLMDRLALT